jgi:hypothetical protein
MRRRPFWLELIFVRSALLAPGHLVVKGAIIFGAALATMVDPAKAYLTM